MKIRFLLIILLPFVAAAQITTPIIKAGFGVDADLRGNFFNNIALTGNDDWFRPAGLGLGEGMIDTTGAAAIVTRYATDPAFRQWTLLRTMQHPSYAVVNGKMLTDAVFIRDFHGDDSTTFSSGNKNTMSPANWNCPVSQSVPDKNEILDMFVHVRRDGASTTDSLWMFGAISIENTTGNRYFDFEMYQTDFYFNRATRQFYNYGPNEGHTAWEFDAAGNVTKPGDIIFTAEFGSASVNLVEARIWVSESVYASVTPLRFSWADQFDKADNSSSYGYASIQPKTAGNFYTGIQSASNTWAGPFALVRTNNTLVTDYTAKQFMEISVNLTLLGLDPVTMSSGSLCGVPFRQIMGKTRSSTSFTAELKDFVGPYGFYQAPKANVQADVTLFCGAAGISTIQVSNPYPTSVYTWSTSDGHITTNLGTSVIVDQPGTYIVNQYLAAGCGSYASDTITIPLDMNCELLSNLTTNLSGKRRLQSAVLNWQVTQNEMISRFETEISSHGTDFSKTGVLYANRNITGEYMYRFSADIPASWQDLFVRIRTVYSNGLVRYSNTVHLPFSAAKETIEIRPNPARDQFTAGVFSNAAEDVTMQILSGDGVIMRTMIVHLEKGENTIPVSGIGGWAPGIYLMRLQHNYKSAPEITRFVIH